MQLVPQHINNNTPHTGGADPTRSPPAPDRPGRAGMINNTNPCPVIGAPHSDAVR
jgi:hypothetical protein